MSLHPELSYDREVDSVRGVQFSVLSPDEIRGRSVCHCTATEMYNHAGEPIPGGLFDARMGVIEHTRICKTCDQRNTMCPGHFGHIELARPVFHVHFFEIVRKLLKCVCFRCSRLLVDIERPDVKAFLSKKHSRQKRWEYMHRLNNQKVGRCGAQTMDGCGALQPSKIQREGIYKVVFEWKDTSAATTSAAAGGEEDGGADVVSASGVRRMVLTAEDVLRILRRITDADAEVLGFHPRYCRPEWLLCTVLPVPPPAVRPSVRNDGGQRCEDDLTHCLLHIVKTNNTLQQRIDKGSNPEHIDVMVSLLQSFVAALVDNGGTTGLLQMKQRTGRPLRAVTDRLKGKEGRIRGNLMGKRVDFSARSVITPDPNISIDELGVPLRIAMNLTFPEVVSAANRERLQRLVSTGPGAYPGARYVRKTATDGRVLVLKKIVARDAIELQDGDMVDRHLQDGDVVLFNRQPSLHKMSMMAHRIRVMPYNTFRLNVCVCPVFNSDFDGDEMNMHVPQSAQTLEELRQLAAVSKQIITPRMSKPLISVVQDITLGIYKISQPDVRIPEKAFFNILAANPRAAGRLPGRAQGDIEGQWTGHQALTTIMPPNVNVRMRNGLYDEDREGGDPGNLVVVRGGVYEGGVCDKGIYQAATDGLVHTIYNESGHDAARVFFDDTQRLVCDWLMHYGFSVGISDLVVDRGTLQAIAETIADMKAQVNDTILQVHAGRFENLSTKNDADHFEETVFTKLNQAVNKIGKMARQKAAGTRNRMLDMINSGAKGNLVNFGQMIGCLGQQSIDAKRIGYGFEHRTLPHYTKYDDSPEARGFVSNSFISGLSPQEFFFHAMGGREGLIDTAVKSVTGDTPVVIVEAGKARRVPIGAWIDGYLDAEDAAEKVRHFPEDRNMELLDLPEGTVYIPTADEAGRVSWGEVTAVTRHDPGTALYRVTTAGGRSVTVAASQSLIVWDEERGGFFEKPSPEVRPGDELPVTARLPAPPVIVDHVDMTTYFPKTEYVYGTDFNRAVAMMEEAMKEPTTKRLEGCKDAEDRQQIPRGWWQKHNGTDFVLPYPRKALLQRAIVRSNTENVLDGCVYPYIGSRCSARLPERFELDHDNGVFIGLYLADGCTHEMSGTVSIAKEDVEVQEWVKAWFAKYNIISRVDVSQKLRGVSTSTIGSSRLLARFLDAFVGKGARNKYVPDEAFTAPEEFVVGLLSGYFSGDGTVGEAANAVSACSVSPRLIEGVSLLCNRLGIFGKQRVSQQTTTNLDMDPANIAPVQHLDIRSKWASVFQQRIQLIIPYKQQRLENMKCTAVHRNFPAQEDVVRDRVLSIEVLGVEKHPKLYDITVPSTLNFVIANGMGVKDTSDSGYIQRKLVKAMEDCKVHHDYTVRETTGSIVQFLFGEDGVDPIRREKQRLTYVEQTAEQMLAEHCWRDEETVRPYLTAEAWKDLQASHPGWLDRVFDHYRQLRRDRAFLIQKVFRGKREKTISYPIAFQRLIRDAAELYRAAGADALKTDLDPVYVLDTVDALCRDLVVSPANPGNGLLQMLLRLHFSPKPLIARARLDRFAFDKIVDEVRARFLESLANPGEMVGVVAAQSLGEPTTQLSCHRFAEIVVQRPDGSMYKGPIGELVDELLEADAQRVVDLGGDSTVLDLEAPYRIVGVSDQEKTSWRPISQVSRHPANGGMVRIHTRSGKTTCATLSHSFLKRTESGIAPVLGSDLKVGDRVPVAKYIPAIDEEQLMRSIDIGGGTVMPLDRDFGWLCGAYLADGWIVRNVVNISKKIPEYYERIREFAGGLGCELRQDVHANSGIKNSFTHIHLAKFLEDEFGNGSFNKRVPAWVFNADRAFVAGLIGGYVDGDGNVNDIPGKQMIRSASVSKTLSQDIIMLLSYFGIFASLSVERKLGVLLQNGQQQSAQYCPQIPRKYAKAFKEHIGFVVKHKAASLDAVIAYVDREDAHNQKDEIDRIPELGPVLAAVGSALRYPQASRTFGRWVKKESIGRRTLQQYIACFEATIDALQNSEELEAVLRGDSGADLEAQQAAIKTLDERLGYETDKDPFGSRRVKQYAANMAKARAAIPEVRAKLAILRQATDSDVVWDEIVRLELLDDPKEYVYDFTVPGNDSFMVDCGVLVHNTLNSVHHDTELLLLRNGALERVDIGPYIDKVIEEAEKEGEADLERHPNDTLLAWLKKDDVKILSGDERGRVGWQKVEAVTRHPVVNEDGSNTLLKVTTHSGREVIATKAKSFLKRVDNRIQQVNGADLKVGDFLPVSTVLPTREVAPIEDIDMSLYLPKTKYIYMSEIQKGLELRAQVGRTAAAAANDSTSIDIGAHVSQVGGKWTKEFNRSFVTPYSRPDILLAAFVGQPKRPATNTFMRANCIYTLKTMGAEMVSHLPERLPLDRDFGWLVGAFLADGCIATGAPRKGAAEKPYAVLICNMSAEFREGVDRFCTRYDIGYHVDEGTRTMKSGYVVQTVSLRMHSLILGELFMELFGQGAAVKRLHPSLFGAPDEFLHGVVDGYWSGDGCVSKHDNSIEAYSVSRGLLEDMRQILVRYGIFAKIRQLSEDSHAKLLSKHATAERGWTLTTTAVDTEKFAKTFTLSLERKQEVLASKSTRLTYALKDTVPDIVTRQWGTVTVNRARVSELLAQAEYEEDVVVLRAVLEDEQVYYDRVVRIVEVPNDKPWVYDFTVENTRNFNTNSGLLLADTFHYSGYSGASAAVRGVPRFKELLRASKNLKTPIMTVYVLPEYSQDKGACKDIMNSIQTTYLRDLVSRSAVHYDPEDTAIAEDTPFVKVYDEWRRQHAGMCPKASDSPWVLRLEFDRSKLLDTGVSLLDVERVLGDFYEDGVSCMFSDDNAAELVGRVRIVGRDEKLDDMLSEVKALEQALLESVPIKGIDRVTKATMYKKDTDDLRDLGNPDNKGATVYEEVQGTFERGFEWVISTAGTNLREILAHGCVDAARTVSNDVVEIWSVLGIEAARQALYDEIMAVLADAFVNYCHVSLLIDTMTHKGYLTSVDRHGINRNDIGPLAKSSFEQTTDILVKAGVFADHDRVLGVSANVMLGQVPRFGTGDCEILVDGVAMAEHAQTQQQVSQPEIPEQVVQQQQAPVAADMFALDMPAV